jgi:hypothetical protein
MKRWRTSTAASPATPTADDAEPPPRRRRDAA